MSSRLAVVFAALSWFAAGSLPARDWKSADGSKTVAALFVSLAGERLVLDIAGKPAAFPLAAFSAEDQQFARNAQAIAEAAAKWGPQSFEISLVLNDGWLCRMALPGGPKKGPLLFTGETIFIAADDPAKGRQGMKIMGRLLFGAGGRAFYPLKGEPSPIRAFALNAELAAKVWMETVGSANGDPLKQSPPVIEPEIKIIANRGIGLALTKEGHVLASEDLVKSAASLAVHIEGRDVPATVVKSDNSLGVALIAAETALVPGKFGARKPAEIGQDIFAVSLEMSPGKRGISPPTLTRGIVSKLTGTGGKSFEHDATIPAGTIGGYAVSEKGDVLGVFFPALPKAAAAKSQPSPAGDKGALPVCVRTDALADFLNGTPAANSIRAMTGSAEMKETAESLRDSTVIVVATSESRTVRGIASLAGKKAPAAAGGPVTGYSISTQGVRHNSKCRFYNPQKPCGAADGKACKTCGG